MAAELVLAPEAQQDVEQAYCWYEDRRIGLGEEFLGFEDACIQSICRIPEFYPREVSASKTLIPEFCTGRKMLIIGEI